MSDVNYTLVIVSGAPVVTGCNKSFYIDDATATGHNRLWRTSSTQRIYWNDTLGWCISDLIGTTGDLTVFFYSGITTKYDNPWEVVTWTTSVEAYKAYNPVLTGSSDPEIETTEEVIKDYKYVLTEDEKFQIAKSYYKVLSGSKYIAVAQVVVGQEIPSNTYYVLKDGKYILNEDDETLPVVFSKNYTYYTRAYTGDASDPYTYVAAVFSGDTIPSSTYYEATALITKTVKTTINHRTGETTSSTDEVITSYSSVLDIHDRYAVPDIEAGKIYRFAFVNDFQSLGYIRPQTDDYVDVEADENDSDITRGIYRVESTTTYYDLVTSGIDIYQNLYLPCGISKTIFEEDKAQWMNGDIWLKLVNPMLEAQVYYVPSAIIDGIPDGNVTPYNRYHMIIDIGIFSDPELLTELVTCVNMLFKAHFGIPTTAELTSYDRVYLPTSYSTWMENQREKNINNFMTAHSEQYFNTLFKTEYNNLEKENNVLRTKVSTYEELVNDLANN